MTASPLSKTAVSLILALCLTVSGCGGTKLLREPKPIEATQMLAGAADPGLDATLDWVVVRDGPGTWARKADWDEYRLQVTNTSAGPLIISSITVFDSLETAIASDDDRKRLVKGSKRAARRYKDSGLSVSAGSGAGSMLVAGAAVTAAGVGAASTALMASSYGAAAGAAGVASGLLLLGPALVVGGVVRGVNGSSVNKEISARQTDLPLTLSANERQSVVAFFPITPSPTRLEIRYTDASGDHLLVIDTSVSLNGLHLGGVGAGN